MATLRAEMPQEELRDWQQYAEWRLFQYAEADRKELQLRDPF